MIVVFDTNAYRDLSAGKTNAELISLMHDIVAKEKSIDYHGYMCTTVAMELMYHLQDNKLWKSYRSCINAAPAMYLHCGDNNSFRLLPLPETQIAKAFFDIDAVNSITTQKSIGSILYDLSQGEPGTVATKYNSELTKVHQFIANAERSLAEEMDKLLTVYDPNYKHDWNPFVNDDLRRSKYIADIHSPGFKIVTAKAMIIAVGMMLQSQGLIKEVPQYGRLDVAAKAYVQHYGVSLLFRERFFDHLAGGNFDITKNSRANYLWDEMILHFAGNSVNGESIMIVTTDGNMRKAIVDFDSTIPTMTLKEYLVHIGV